MVYRCDPVCPGHWRALGIGNRNQIHVMEFSVDRGQTSQIESPMERGHRGDGLPSRKRKMKIINMKMHNVKTPRIPKYQLEHPYIVSEWIDCVLCLPPKRPRANWNEICRRD
jgi:hypothetical protein